MQGIFRTIHLFFATLDNEPITVERFVDGEFTKYVNKDGNPCQKMLGKSSIFEQAEASVHFSYKASNKALLLVDLLEADHKLCNQLIATIGTLNEAPSVEKFFCTVLAILEKQSFINFLKHLKILNRISPKIVFLIE